MIVFRADLLKHYEFRNELVTLPQHIVLERTRYAVQRCNTGQEIPAVRNINLSVAVKYIIRA